MQNKSIRVRTTPGVDKNIRVELNQDFDFIEILSLKIAQEDIYESFCADYGVLVGRVTSNKGFGIPNAKVSVFIPIKSEDERNDLIRTLYPYKTVTSKNDEGYRYNLFLSEVVCSINQTVGTFPTKEEVLTNDIQLEIFEKYYRYTTKTNDSGDYIIFGVPTGQQTIHLDVDLSDIGILSVRPYEMIEQGFSEKLFDGYTKFRQSTNLDELPQIKTQNKGVDIIPFWGDEDRCSFGITRVDFDTGIEIIPSAVFMGSIFTDNKKNSLKQNCAIKNGIGDQCLLTTRAGSINVLRLLYDENDEPYTIEEFTPRDGNALIDDDGVFSFTLPMYHDRVITDEFGNLVPAIEPGTGIPTKGDYRFKLKFNEPGLIKKQTTASLIVPSLHRNYGGTLGSEQQRWATGLVTDIYNTNLNQPHLTVVNGGGQPSQNYDNPEDYAKTLKRDLKIDFHTFEWKQVYTLSQFIKKVKKGSNRFSHIGIKGCDECETNNYFPFTTAIKKASILFWLQLQLIKLIAFFYNMIIILGNLRFCFYIRMCFDIAGAEFCLFKCTEIINLKPFGFILDLLYNDGNGLILECSDKTYQITPEELNCIDDCLCANDNNNPVVTGDNSSSTSLCCPDSNGDCTDNRVCFKFSIITPTPSICNALAEIESWKCCAILDAARENNAIRFSFHDAWINGTAYLYQFRAKSKVRSDGSRKDKFCGPGSDNVGGNNYVKWDDYDNCSNGQCLVLGPSSDEEDRNYVGGTDVTDDIYVPQNSPGLPNGANDSNEFIYCNWASSTKIISLGPIEMCDDVFEDIQNCIFTNTGNLAGNSTIDCAISDLRLGDGENPYTGDNYGVVSQFTIPSNTTPNYNFPKVIKVGTGGERGFDRQETTKKLTESSYTDPEDVLIYFLLQEDCDFKDLFLGQGGCNEYELKADVQKYIRKVCQIQNEIVTIPPADSQTGAYLYEDPEVWDFGNGTLYSGVATSAFPGDPDIVNGPFEVDPLLDSRYHPNPENDPNNLNTNSSLFANPHLDTKTNMPYFYFGLVPGKSAIDKFRSKYLVN